MKIDVMEYYERETFEWQETDFLRGGQQLRLLHKSATEAKLLLSSHWIFGAFSFKFSV